MSNPMGGDYWVTPADLEAASTHTRKVAGDVEAELVTLRGYVAQLSTYWQGPAQGTFNTLMEDWNIYAKMLNDALLDIASGMEGNKVNYEDTEQANMRNLHYVNLPAARF